MKKWEEMREKKIIAKMQASFQQQMQGITFYPQIDRKSSEIVDRKGRVPLTKREIRAKRNEAGDQFTFHPNLKKGS